MKSKVILSLVMAAAVTLGGATLATNANFNAVANSNGNAITMGTVQLGNVNSGEVGQTINMDTMFSVGNLGTLTDPVTQSRKIVIRGSLPVKLSLGTYDDTHRVFQAVAPSGVISTWWRHYKSYVSVTVDRAAGGQSFYESLPNGQLDSIFDTIEGTTHNVGSVDEYRTAGISEMLAQLGTLYPGDVVTITTKTKFNQTTFYTSKDGDSNYDKDYTLTQDEVNAFQGKSLYVNLKVVATEAK